MLVCNFDTKQVLVCPTLLSSVRIATWTPMRISGNVSVLVSRTSGCFIPATWISSKIMATTRRYDLLALCCRLAAAR